MRAALLLCLLMLAGCSQPSKPALLLPERLREAFPTLTTPYSITEFRARPGLVNQHVKKKGKLVGMLIVEDLLESPQQRAMFDTAPQKLKGYPLVSTSMGGGMALLYKNRFKVEVNAMDPSVSDAERLQWLEGFHLDMLKE